MPERRLHQVDRRPAVEGVAGVGVPKPVGRHGQVDPGPGGGWWCTERCGTGKGPPHIQAVPATPPPGRPHVSGAVAALLAQGASEAGEPGVNADERSIVGLLEQCAEPIHTTAQAREAGDTLAPRSPGGASCLGQQSPACPQDRATAQQRSRLLHASPPAGHPAILSLP
jgi:hypothetical protein